MVCLSDFNILNTFENGLAFVLEKKPLTHFVAKEERAVSLREVTEAQAVSDRRSAVPLAGGIRPNAEWSQDLCHAPPHRSGCGTYRFASFSDHPAGSKGWHSDVSFKLYLLFRADEVLFFNLAINSSLSLQTTTQPTSVMHVGGVRADTRDGLTLVRLACRRICMLCVTSLESELGGPWNGNHELQHILGEENVWQERKGRHMPLTKSPEEVSSQPNICGGEWPLHWNPER